MKVAASSVSLDSYGLNDLSSSFWPPSGSSLSMQCHCLMTHWNYLLSKWFTWCYPKLIHNNSCYLYWESQDMKVQLHHYYKCTSNSIILQNWIPALPSSSLEKNRRGVCWPNFLTRMRCSVKARASGPLAGRPATRPGWGGSISAAAAHCCGWPLMQRLALPHMRGTK